MLANTTYYTTLDNPTVAQLLLAYLKLEQVDTLFGVPGGAMMALLNELKTQQDIFRYIVCRQETGAAYIADGYARVTGKLGVVAVTSGPGATNALTGTMNAQNSGSALLTITGEIAEKYFGMGYLQEGIDASLDVVAVYNNASGYSAVISSASSFQTLFTQALRDALSRPHRAAHISLPNDVVQTQLQGVQLPCSPANYRAIPQAGSPELTTQAFHALLAAERPLLFLGNGCREALTRKHGQPGRTGLEELTAFVEKFGIPVMTTPDAKGIFPENHPLSLRNYGIAGSMWPQRYMDATTESDHYDALMVLGSTLGELATNSWDPILIPHGAFIQVDLEQSIIARAFPVELGIVAEIGQTIHDLFLLGERTQPDAPAVAKRKALVADIKAKNSPFYQPEKRDSVAVPVLPQALMRGLGNALPSGSHVFVDAGNSVGWALHHLTIEPPSQMHNSLAMGPMGFGVGAVIGGKLGAPDAVCVGIVGDGAFLMHGSEISTAAQYGIGAIWLVLNDNDLAMVSQGMNHFYSEPNGGWNDYYQIGKPDLVQYAQSLGADACRIDSVAEMGNAVKTAIAQSNANHKPQVIVAHIDTQEIPPYYIQHPTTESSDSPAPAIRTDIAVVRSPVGAVVPEAVGS